MMMTRIYTTRVIFLLAAFACVNQLSAQSGGSGYSRYGIGDLRYAPTSRAVGMGGAGIGVLSTNTIDRLNPAARTRINRTRFDVGMLYEGFSTSDASSSAYLSQATFNGFMIAIPISPSSGVIFAAGISPYSRINYSVTTASPQGDLPYNAQYLGNGGLSQGQVGLSATVANDIHLGVDFDYYFGTLRYATRQLFSVSDYTTAEVTRSNTLRGLGFTVGGIYSGLQKVLGLSNPLNIGLMFSSSSRLTSQEERYLSYNTTTVTTLDTVASPEGTAHLPVSGGGGISYTTERLLLAADFYYQKWSDFRLNGASAAELRDSYRFGIGTEFLPKRDPSTPFTQRIAYRLGFFYNNSYFRIRNEPINEIGVTGGFGIPVLGDTRLNIGGEYSFRGTTDKQLQKDKILRVSVTLSGSELWFVRPQSD